VALDLGRPPLVALGEDAGGVAAEGDRGGEEERLAGDDLFRLAHVGDHPLDRLAGAGRGGRPRAPRPPGPPGRPAAHPPPDPPSGHSAAWRGTSRCSISSSCGVPAISSRLRQNSGPRVWRSFSRTLASSRRPSPAGAAPCAPHLPLALTLSMVARSRSLRLS